MNCEEMFSLAVGMSPQEYSDELQKQMNERPWRPAAIAAYAKWPLICYGVIALGFMHYSQYTLFSFHPFFMIVGFICFAGNAILIKKIGGYENTKFHGYLMLATCASIGK